MAKELGINMIVYQMTMDVMHLKKEDLVEDIEVGEAITYLELQKMRISH
ncbi:DsrE/DsrF/DrsH-like family protein [Bacillus sp. DX4.1]|nr:DsrE/DsrF/DrsH-like family protein [Bacillus sp. DX4.1]MDM5187221.1 DsrE/DsrF/DrsH-like family protein [Bacillus sp. DX4.1]